MTQIQLTEEEQAALYQLQTHPEFGVVIRGLARQFDKDVQTLIGCKPETLPTSQGYVRCFNTILATLTKRPS